MVTETRSKIRRQRRCSVIIPRFITSPEEVYWKLPEGKLIFSGTNWLQKYAEYAGFEMFQIAFKQRLGKVNSGVWKYTIVDADKKNQKSVVVKNLSESSYWEKSSFGSWLNSQKKFKSSPLFRLATEYKALRYLRSIGLKTPLVEAMVIGKRLLITQHIEGVTMKILANDLLVGRRESSLDLRPQDIIITNKHIYFTGLNDFKFDTGDPNWDTIRFFAYTIGKTSNTDLAKKMARVFFRGYKKKANSERLQDLARSERYIEYLYPTITRSIGQIISHELGA
jgi:tRNA A-37 threonylcarbamoyl transferase component Bud32